MLSREQTSLGLGATICFEPRSGGGQEERTCPIGISTEANLDHRLCDVLRPTVNAELLPIALIIRKVFTATKAFASVAVCQTNQQPT